MAEETWHIMVLVFRAVEAGPVRIASGTADSMASNAELLTRAAVTACARHWIDTSLLPMLSARRRNPAGGVRIARG
jgi:hypothetical protein